MRVCVLVGWVALVVGMSWANMGTAADEVAERPAQVPVESLPADLRASVSRVLDNPTVSARGQRESFLCRPSTYHWLLDNPHRASWAWKRLGAKCVDIQKRSEGVFGWSDEQGSDVSWRTIYQDDGMRIWYASGKVKPALLLPMAPVEVVLVLTFEKEPEHNGLAMMHHRVQFYLHTDSKIMTLAARILGMSAPRAAEQYVAQMEMFFSAMSWYLDQHPTQVEQLLSPPGSSGRP